MLIFKMSPPVVLSSKSSKLPPQVRQGSQRDGKSINCSHHGFSGAGEGLLQEKMQGFGQRKKA
jgi:hypothetical protein